MENPLDDLSDIIGAQISMIESLENSEKHLMEVRNLLNETLRSQDSLSDRDLILKMLKANSGQVAATICMIQSQSANAKASLTSQKQAIDKMKSQLGDLGLFEDESPDGE